MFYWRIIDATSAVKYTYLERLGIGSGFPTDYQVVFGISGGIATSIAAAAHGSRLRIGTSRRG